MPDCDVCLYGYDGDVEFFYERQRIARRPHECYDGCGTTIQPGVLYFQVGGKCEGYFWHGSICRLCREIGDVFAYGNGRTYGNLWEEIEEVIFPDLTVRSPCFNKLGLEARGFVTERWWNWKERHASS